MLISLTFKEIERLRDLLDKDTDKVRDYEMREDLLTEENKSLDTQLKGMAFDIIGLTKDLNSYIRDHGSLLIEKSQLNAKLQVAVEALEWADKFLPNSPVKIALEKIKGDKK